MSSIADSSERNVLYKVFIRKRPSNAPIEKDKLEEMFGLIAEPFKIHVNDGKAWALAFFTTGSEARACVGAFHDQPPFNYHIEIARDEVCPMNSHDIKKIDQKLQYQARKLRQIQIQLKELRLEEARLKNNLNGRCIDADSDCYNSGDDCESMMNESVNSPLSGSRMSLSSSHNSRSHAQTRGNNQNGFNQGNNQQSYVNKQQPYGNNRNRQVNENHPYEEADRAFSKNVPDREYNYVQPNRPPRSSESFNDQRTRSRTPNHRESEFKDHQQRNQTPNRRESQNFRRESQNYSGEFQNHSREQQRSQTPNYRESRNIRRESQNNFGESQNNSRESQNYQREPHSNQNDSFDKEQPLPGILKNKLINHNDDSAEPIPVAKPSAPPVVKPVPAIRPVQPVESKNNTKKCVVELVKPSQSGILKLKSVENLSGIAQCDIAGAFVEQLEIIRNLWENYSETDAITPAVGDFVCVENDDSWSRGYVVKNLNYGWKVALIDEGIFVSAAKPCKVLAEHENVPEFACRCDVEKVLIEKGQFTEIFLPNKSFGFTVKQIEGPTVLCTLKDRKTKQDICEIRLSRWLPLEILPTPAPATKPNRKITEPKLPSGSLVMIAYVVTQNDIYVKYRETAELLNKITNLMSENEKFSPLCVPVEVGDCIAAKYIEDGEWYRAIVKSINGPSLVVSYVDYGNNDKITIENARELPAALLEVQRAILNVKLSNVPAKPLTLKQAKFFEECTVNKIKYRIEYDKSGVILTKNNSEDTLNEQVLNVEKEQKKIEPSPSVIPTREPVEAPKKPVEAKEKVQLATEDTSENVVIKSTELPLGKKTELIFQNVVNAEDRVIVCYKNDIEALTYAQVHLTQELSDYIDSSKPPPFAPTSGMYCIALFDDAWYRAICLDLEDDAATVLFVDFGNFESVPVKNIRTLPPKFAKAPGVAIICTVEGVPKKITEEQFGKFFTELDTYEAEVIRKDEDDQYTIKMPHIA